MRTILNQVARPDTSGVYEVKHKKKQTVKPRERAVNTRIPGLVYDNSGRKRTGEHTMSF